MIHVAFTITRAEASWTLLLIAVTCGAFAPGAVLRADRRRRAQLHRTIDALRAAKMRQL